MLTFEVIRRGSPDFVGLRDIFSGPLSDGPVIAMLCFVVHRLGDSRKSAREVGASRLFCFNAGLSGSPNGLSFRRAVAAQFLCISRLSVLAFLNTSTLIAQDAKSHRSYRKILRNFPARKV